MNYKNRWRLIFLLSSIFVLAACKGGGDSAPTNSGSPTPSPSSDWDQAAWDQSNWA